MRAGHSYAFRTKIEHTTILPHKKEVGKELNLFEEFRRNLLANTTKLKEESSNLCMQNTHLF
jgi:hypothetical protein